LPPGARPRRIMKRARGSRNGRETTSVAGSHVRSSSEPPGLRVHTGLCESFSEHLTDAEVETMRRILRKLLTANGAWAEERCSTKLLR
jgi:hypothetical protein